jgi:Skp family chaperone for outer membrane proteins
MDERERELEDRRVRESAQLQVQREELDRLAAELEDARERLDRRERELRAYVEQLQGGFSRDVPPLG